MMRVHSSRTARLDVRKRRGRSQQQPWVTNSKRGGVWSETGVVRRWCYEALLVCPIARDSCPPAKWQVAFTVGSAWGN